MAVDVKRRKEVMARSMKLGHCVCNPKNPCPCDTFKTHNICPCAGEKMPPKQEATALTQHVRKAGCASKIGQADLKRILGQLPPITDPKVLVGMAAGDDAGIYQLDEHLALVQTVDVFTPCVDDPHLFGKIAAANSLSDVYAMGGTPLTALSVVGFPIDEMAPEVMTAMLQGGMETLAEADCALIGGHSINDEETKLGFAITGRIDPQGTIQRDHAYPGDVLLLTKPLGTGIISFAAQIGAVSAECLSEAGRWMAQLNKDAAELMQEYGAHACTDVTGFGLAGHLTAMVQGSKVNAEVALSQTPVMATVPACLERGIYGGAIDRNREFALPQMDLSAVEGAAALPILFDPQTSGGLLIAMPEEAAQDFIQAMNRRGHTAVGVIGNITAMAPDQHEGRVIVTDAALSCLIGTEEHIMEPKGITEPASTEAMSCCAPEDAAACCSDTPPEAVSCCSEAPPAVEGDSEAEATLAIFQDFMKAVNQPGRIDVKQKKLMAIVLSIAHHCKPCLKIHLQAGLRMGISKAEMDEAANLAIAFGGGPAMMFYRETCREIDWS